MLDVSAEALQQSRQRLAAARGEPAAASVRWIESDILGADLPQAHYALWHDRAVFHFLVDDSEQSAYVALAARSLRSGGVAIIATFAPDGPERCSGLPVQRYDARALALRFGDAFELLASSRERHAAPTGASQPFTYVALRRAGPILQPRAAHASP
jgi:SAM-dependent methyltransferase